MATSFNNGIKSNAIALNPDFKFVSYFDIRISNFG